MKTIVINRLRWWMFLVGMVAGFGALGQVDTVELKDSNKLEENWLNHKAYLADQFALPIAKRNLNVDSITQVVEQLEVKLAAKSKAFTPPRKTIKLKDIQAKLKPNEALVQFSHFQYYDVGKWTDSTLYVAYLTYSGDEMPEMVYLFEEKQLDSLLAMSTANTGDLYRGSKPLKKGTSPVATGQALYDLIWKPILSHLDGDTHPHPHSITTLYLNPSGLLHRINLATIPIDSTTRIFDKYKVNYISSARNFVLSKQRDYANTALIIGGLDYNSSETSTDSTAKYLYEEDKGVMDLKDRTSLSGSWNYLKGTAIEAQKINELLTQNGYQTTHLTGRYGTENAVKHCGSDTIASPRILHLATYSFAFPASKETLNDNMSDKNPYRYKEDPLLRTGLLLSGANNAWQGQALPSDQEDNILTSYEIGHLDLTETELVVLSACETGLGDIVGNEGVYGLQRGFKMAGVKYLIMSLSKVPDMETQELMVLFYEYWLEEGMEIRDAFRAAQGVMRERYEGEPEMWVGFILVE